MKDYLSHTNVYQYLYVFNCNWLNCLKFFFLSNMIFRNIFYGMEFLASFCTVSDKYLSERFLVDFETNRTFFFFKYHGVKVVSTPLQMSFCRRRQHSTAVFATSQHSPNSILTRIADSILICKAGRQEVWWSVGIGSQLWNTLRWLYKGWKVS